MPVELSLNQISAYRAALDRAAAQVDRTVEREPDFFPMYTAGGRWARGAQSWTEWTGGFYAGLMWLFWRHTGRAVWRARAEHFSRLLELRQHDRDVHDLGFIFWNSFGPWWQATGDAALASVLWTAGQTLSLRFQPRGEYLCSFLGPQSLFIDIMMNVSLVWRAGEALGDQKLKETALAHARTTRERLVRADGSTAHEGLFDVETGKFLRQSTQQGWSAESCWSRGLAWSLYGFTTMFELTGDATFLETAERNAAYLLAHLPDDGVPPWDFDAPADTREAPGGRDSSAGAIAASGLFDLARVTREEANAMAYRAQALRTLDTLVLPEYLADGATGWEGILLHAIYHRAKGLAVDESVIWGDFFFVEALTKALAFVD